MNVTEIFTTAGAILAGIGIGGSTVAAPSNWLGKVLGWGGYLSDLGPIWSQEIVTGANVISTL